jgi:signal transduction histidine kinase
VASPIRYPRTENLDQRLALGGPPGELKELADTFDAMLARPDAAFASQRRFVANASYELRTPLTEVQVTLPAITRPERTGLAPGLDEAVGLRLGV